MSTDDTTRRSEPAAHSSKSRKSVKEASEPRRRLSRSLSRVQPMDVLKVPGAQLTIETVCAVTGRSRSSIYAMVKAKTFPKPRAWGPRCSRWQAAEVVAWLTAQATPEGQ